MMQLENTNHADTCCGRLWPFLERAPSSYQKSSVGSTLQDEDEAVHRLAGVPRSNVAGGECSELYSVRMPLGADPKMGGNP